MFDPAGSFEDGLDVHVKDGIIQSVGRRLPGATGPFFDMAGAWLLPGFFDCHSHVTMSSVDLEENLRRPLSRWVLDAARNAQRTIEAGVTFVRDAGGADAGLRDAIAAGVVEGPTLQISTVMISRTGGHADGTLAGLSAELYPQAMVPSYPGRPPFLADGPDEMRRVVREVLRSGADWIKLAATGGFVSDHDSPLDAELSPEDIAVAVEEARRRGKHVMVHAYGGDALLDAVAAGVRSIEHGSYLTEEEARAMATAGCWLVPTLTTFDDLRSAALDGSLGTATTDKVLSLLPELGANVAVALAYGVRIAVGTDSVVARQHGGNLRELALLHRAGMSVEEALLAATADAAELCGVEDQRGRLLPGHVFDAVVFDQEPSDLDALADGRLRPSGVFKRGRPVVRHSALDRS